jgi:hypothetical protein
METFPSLSVGLERNPSITGKRPCCTRDKRHRYQFSREKRDEFAPT